MLPKCPDCRSSARRSALRWYEQWLKRVSRRRPFRCDSCRRRFWAAPPAEKAEVMEERDLERILRDVVNTQGLPVTIVRVRRLGESWVVTVTDHADRIVGTTLPDGPPAAIRAALVTWLNSVSTPG